MNLEDLTLDVEQHVDIAGPIADVFKSVLHNLGEGNKGENGESLQMSLEEWAGGRWFRDRGAGVQHLWGHVQVIKPPVLVEISGPMFMSYPALNHLEIKLAENDGGTRLSLRHRAIGMIDPQHREGVKYGWQALIDAIAADIAKASGQSA